MKNKETKKTTPPNVLTYMTAISEQLACKDCEL